MIRPLIVLAALVLAVPASARDDRNLYPLDDALKSPNAQAKLDSGVALYFAGQKHPGVAKTMGEFRTNKKTNAVNKSDKEACEWVFLAAMLELQERARKEGGNAVIDITSNYKSIETRSATQYMCVNGAIMAGVAFKGTVVKTSGK